jgi:hypothetical protein
MIVTGSQGTPPKKPLSDEPLAAILFNTHAVDGIRVGPTEHDHRHV